jgi:hypothetical protein
MVLPRPGVPHHPNASASLIRAPKAWGLAGQYQACCQETCERGDDGHPRRKQRQGQLAHDHQQ